MVIVKVTTESIELAVNTIQHQGVISYPTDTVYGLGCDPTSDAAVKRIIQIKKWRHKPLPILASSLSIVETTVELTGVARKLIDKYWPGPLTIILHGKRKLSEYVTMGSDSIAIRIPNHPVALSLIKGCGGLIVGTSANITGNPPCITADCVEEMLGRSVDMILNGGKSTLGESSTILDARDEQIRVVRRGALKKEEWNMFLPV